jgi:hypothetical protein
VAVAAASLLLPASIVIAAPAPKSKPRPVSISFERSFTPAQADPRLAAALASRPAFANDFHFTPASYNLGVAVGWKRFAVAGDVATAKTGNPALGGREGAVVGVSYNLKRFTGRVAASADRPTGRPAPALADSPSYALDVGGAYNISSRVAVTGGVRYRIERDKLATLNDQRRDSQAVYVGTAIKF